VPCPQIGAAAFLRDQLQAVDAGEEIEAFLELVRIDLDMSRMGDIQAGLGHAQCPASIPAAGQAAAQCIRGVGRLGEISGKAISTGSVTSIATQNGSTPAKILPSGTFLATDLTINTFTPTGGEISPISSVSTTRTPNQIGSMPSAVMTGK